MRKRRRTAKPREQQVRPTVEELGGESESSMHEALIDELNSSHRMRGRPEEEIDIQPEDMGRNALERATEASPRQDECVEPLRGPLR